MEERVSGDTEQQNRVTKLKAIASGEDEDEFKKFHAFVFRYHMLKPGQKTLELDAATLLIQIVLGKKYPISAQFIRFLKDTGKKTLGRDQWENMIEIFHILEKKEKDTSGACKFRYGKNVRATDLRRVLHLAQRRSLEGLKLTDV